MRKVYPPDFLALDGFDFELHEGEFVSLIGPNGCGKTTFLKIVTGIEDYQDGILQFDGNDLKGTDWHRSIIFQEIRLFPWMTIRDNIYFGLTCKGLSKKDAKIVAEKWIKNMRLEKYCDLYPQETSAGTRQIANVARILALGSDLILCDEPFNFLDWKTRNFLQTELLRYWHKTKKTVLFVTHNMEEAVYMSQKVFIMTARPGRVKKIIKVNLPEKRWEIRGDDARFLNIVEKAMGAVGDEIKKSQKMDGFS